MDQQTLATITQLASRMPVYYQSTTRTLSGKELLDMGFRDWQGEPVKETGKYRIPVRVQTNNVRSLTRLYRTKGMEAVRAKVESNTIAQ